MPKKCPALLFSKKISAKIQNTLARQGQERLENLDFRLLSTADGLMLAAYSWLSGLELRTINSCLLRCMIRQYSMATHCLHRFLVCNSIHGLKPMAIVIKPLGVCFLPNAVILPIVRSAGV